MIVFGDLPCRTAVEPKIDLVRWALDRRAAAPRGIDRHTWLVLAFVELAELVQALVDDEAVRRGGDDLGPVEAHGLRLLRRLAAAIDLSLAGGLSGGEPGADLIDLGGWPSSAEGIVCKAAEGHAFYALYPEAYLLAARRSGVRGGPVIGLRSIGVGLAAAVAEGLGAAATMSVRPFGPPFARQVRFGPVLAAAIARAGWPVSIVDEGPGLSGSSLGATADAIESLGIAPRHVHVFPGHLGPLGSAASDAHRVRWQAARKHVVPFDALFGPAAADPRRRVTRWFEAEDGEPTDLSGGAWRAELEREETAWPPAHVQLEARKILAHRRDGPLLLKFIGLGAGAIEKAARARDLHAAGFAPESIGYKHGFLATRWLGTSKRLEGAPAMSHLAAYLAFRARAFPASPHGGATAAALWQMACKNVGEGCGPRSARALAAAAPPLDRIERAIRRVDTDNRLHRWEWRVTSDGRVWKLDALDHSRGHDLVGCQDLAWDVVGARYEFELTDRQMAELVAALAREGKRVDEQLIAFYDLCYPAFQLGYYTLASAALSFAPAEQARCRSAAARYAACFARRRALARNKEAFDCSGHA